MLKKILYIAVGLIIVFAIVKVNDIYHSFTARKTAEESVVLLESIRKVTKLVAYSMVKTKHSHYFFQER